MIAPIGMNTNAIRLWNSASGAAHAARGSMASRPGSASDAPRPLSSGRRESGFIGVPGASFEGIKLAGNTLRGAGAPQAGNGRELRAFSDANLPEPLT